MLNCVWDKDEISGDQLLFCPEKQELLRIEASVIESVNHAAEDAHILKIDKLKQKIIEELSCHECEQSNSGY